MNYLNKKTITIFLIVGIAIAGVLLVLNSKKNVTEEENSSSVQDEPLAQATTTLETQIYRNEKWGFEFWYPTNWKVEENTFGSYYSKFNLVINPTLVRSSNFTISVNLVLSEFSERSFKNIEKTTSEVTVGRVLGIKYQYEFKGSQETAIILPFGEYQIILGIDDEQYTEIFNQVVATFKFLK